MKTKALLSIIVTLLFLNVKSSDATTHFPELAGAMSEASVALAESLVLPLEYQMDEMIEVDAWMLNENAFDIVFETEMLPVSDWMFEEDNWQEPFSEIEEWMFNVSSFENNSFAVEQIMNVEAWMLSPDAFDAEFIEPLDECPLKAWMFNF